MRNQLLRPRRALPVVAAAGLMTLLSGSIAAQRFAIPAKADTRTVVHVLNRIGFGPRPGDIERVQQIGLAAYIEQQLNPARIPNAALDERLTQFTTLDLSTRELADQFFVPADMARRQQQQLQAKQKEMFSMVSAILRMRHETRSAVIGNIR